MKRLVSIEDMSRRDIEKVFFLTEEVKSNPSKYKSVLQGQKFGLIFEKPSMRTWVSFDVGICSMGGGAIYLGPDDIIPIPKIRTCFSC